LPPANFVPSKKDFTAGELRILEGDLATGEFNVAEGNLARGKLRAAEGHLTVGELRAGEVATVERGVREVKITTTPMW
jgi:hypothetical protein